MSSNLPLLFSASGPTPTPPATLQQALIALVETMAPGYTAALPGSLIEDLSSTAVGALATIDQARVDAVNNVSPYAANPYILGQEGVQFGVPQGLPSNGSAYLVFTGSPGFVIAPGWLVSDGSNQYAVRDGGIVGSGGTSPPVYVVATNSATFPIPANSIDQNVTPVPGGYTLTVTNPLAGTPAQASETTESYRSRLLSAFNVALSGTQTYLKTLLLAVPGVSPQLVSVIQNGIYWEVICGGGDPYAIAGAIYSGVSTLGLLTGSSINTDRNVTVSIYDVPNEYEVVFVNPPEQVVTVAVTWNTTLPNFVASAAVNQAIILAVQSYVNGILVGQPINLLVMNEVIQNAVAPVLSPVNLTTLEFVVTIDSEVVEPTAGTWIIPSDPESYFAISATGCTSAQG